MRKQAFELKQTWNSQASFEADLEQLEPVVRDVMHFRGKPTDTHGIQNVRTGQVHPVGAEYALLTARDLAHGMLDTAQEAGIKVQAVDFWATSGRHFLGLYGTPESVGGDLSPYTWGLVALNATDGTLGAQIALLSKRLFCSNQFHTTFKDVEKYRHTNKGLRNFSAVLSEVGRAAWAERIEVGRLLKSARDVDVGNLGTVLNDTFGMRNGAQVLKLLPRYVASATLDGRSKDPSATAGLTAWSVFQAATDHFSNGDSAASAQSRDTGSAAAFKWLKAHA